MDTQLLTDLIFLLCETHSISTCILCGFSLYKTIVACINDSTLYIDQYSYISHTNSECHSLNTTKKFHARFSLDVPISSSLLYFYPTGFVRGFTHYETLDGWQYTYSGYGEYVLLRSKQLAPVPYVMIQGRTSKVISAAKGTRLRYVKCGRDDVTS